VCAKPPHAYVGVHRVRSSDYADESKAIVGENSGIVKRGRSRCDSYLPGRNLFGRQPEDIPKRASVLKRSRLLRACLRSRTLSVGDQRPQVPRIVKQDVMASAILQTIPASLVASPTSSARQPPDTDGVLPPHRFLFDTVLTRGTATCPCGTTTNLGAT
jgi:hypothetical protein